MTDLCDLELENITPEQDEDSDQVDFLTPEGIITTLLMEALKTVFIGVGKVVIYGSFGRWMKKQWKKFKTQKKSTLNLRDFVSLSKGKDMDLLCTEPAEIAEEIFKLLKKIRPDVVMKTKEGGGRSLFCGKNKIIDFSKISDIAAQTEDIARIKGGIVTVLTDIAIVSTVCGYFETFGSTNKSKFMYNILDFVEKLQDKVEDAMEFFPKMLPKTSELPYLTKTDQKWIPLEYKTKYEQLCTCEQAFPLFIRSSIAEQYLGKVYLATVIRNTPFRKPMIANKSTRIKKELVFISEGVSRKNAEYETVGVSETSKYYKLNDTTYCHLRPPTEMKGWVVQEHVLLSPLYQVCRIVDKINLHTYLGLKYDELYYMYCVYAKFIKNVVEEGHLVVLITGSESDTEIATGDIVT